LESSVFKQCSVLSKPPTLPNVCSTVVQSANTI
jgi:hypothetical protein